MAGSTSSTELFQRKAATRLTIVVAFASVYVFWGSTYTAIRVATAYMPALLMAGIRFTIAGAILLGWCRWRGLRLFWPTRIMLLTVLVGLLLLGGGNVGLVYAEETVPSGLASLMLAIVPLYIAVLEMILPGGEPLPRRGWLGLLLGFLGLAALMEPSLHSGLSGDRKLLVAIAVLLAGGFCWAVGGIVSRRARLQMNSFVAASWQMLAAGLASLALGSTLGQWPSFHVTAGGMGALAYLITGGSLLGYTGFIYLIEHVPVAKVSSYCYVNPMVAVVLGIFFLHERPAPAEFLGMGTILVAVYLLTTSRVTKKLETVEELEQLPAD